MLFKVNFKIPKQKDVLNMNSECAPFYSMTPGYMNSFPKAKEEKKKRRKSFKNILESISWIPLSCSTHRIAWNKREFLFSTPHHPLTLTFQKNEILA